MATKMKGIYKGFKYISNIFVVKERELEIGYPTDVKHVAHIGWDGQSDTGPSWMTEYKAAPDFSTASVNDMGASRNNNGIQVPSWSTRDFDQPMGGKHGSEMIKNSSLTDRPKASKKQKRKKIKSAASSPRASGSTSRTTSRASKTKASLGKCVSHLETLKTCKE